MSSRVIIVCCVSAAFAGAALFGKGDGRDQQGTEHATTLRAQRFVVVSPEGKEVGEFGYAKGAVRLRIPPSLGQPGVVVGKYRQDEWSGLALVDENGKPRFAVEQSAKTGPALKLYDSQNRVRLSISMGKNDNEVAINVLNSNGRITLGIGTDYGGRPSVALLGPDGSLQAGGAFYVSSDGRGHLVLKDRSGTVQVELPPRDKPKNP